MSKGKLIFDANLLFYPDSGIVDSTVNTTFFNTGTVTVHHSKFWQRGEVSLRGGHIFKEKNGTKTEMCPHTCVMARITSFSLLCCWEESSSSLFSCDTGQQAWRSVRWQKHSWPHSSKKVLLRTLHPRTSVSMYCPHKHDCQEKKYLR